MATDLVIIEETNGIVIEISTPPELNINNTIQNIDIDNINRVVEVDKGTGGLRGIPGPNNITNETETTFSGILIGDGNNIDTATIGAGLQLENKTLLAINVPAGNDTEVQYNHNGELGATPNFTWNDLLKTLKLLSDSNSGFYVTISTGTDSQYFGGSLVLLGGNNANNGGNLDFYGGNAFPDGNGGILTFQGGHGGVGGDIFFRGGSSYNNGQEGGVIQLIGGTGRGAGQGGVVYIIGGSGGSSGIGGSIILEPGLGVGSVPGFIYLSNSNTGGKIKLDLSNIPISTTRVIIFPSNDGTLALQSTASGSFQSADGKIITVTNGIITNIA